MPGLGGPVREALEADRSTGADVLDRARESGPEHGFGTGVVENDEFVDGPEDGTGTGGLRRCKTEVREEVPVFGDRSLKTVSDASHDLSRISEAHAIQNERDGRAKPTYGYEIGEGNEPIRDGLPIRGIVPRGIEFVREWRQLLQFREDLEIRAALAERDHTLDDLVRREISAHLKCAFGPPNVWHQRRAQRVRCMPGLGSWRGSLGPELCTAGGRMESALELRRGLLNDLH